MSIVQAVFTHIVLTTRKVVLDQFREGLKLLGGYVLPTKPIKVLFYFGEVFFVSTCSLKLDCPNAFRSFEEFENTLEAAIHTTLNVV